MEPPGLLLVRLERDTAEMLRAVDSGDADFSFEGIPSGIVRLHLTRPSDTRPVHTDWFRV